ncbi:MAG: molecular chaperone [Candidatus Kapaibacterium sp.]
MKATLNVERLIATTLTLLATLHLSASAQGPGDLLVTPTRTLFEGGKRNEVLTLINRGSDTATYRMSVLQYRMTSEGNLEVITTPDEGQLFATDLIRFFPREVTIPPGETQNVRVQLRTPADLADGEYRSHLYFRAVPKVEPLTGDEDSSTTEFSVKLSAIYGVSIPMIVRKGELEASVTMRDLTLKSDSGRASVRMTFDRQGSSSVYGTVRIYHESSSGVRTAIGGIGGVAIYTPNVTRSFSLPLSLPEGIDLSEGRVIVTYESQSETSSTLLTEGRLELSK